MFSEYEVREWVEEKIAEWDGKYANDRISVYKVYKETFESARRALIEVTWYGDDYDYDRHGYCTLEDGNWSPDTLAEDIARELTSEINRMMDAGEVDRLPDDIAL